MGAGVSVGIGVAVLVGVIVGVLVGVNVGKRVGMMGSGVSVISGAGVKVALAGIRAVGVGSFRRLTETKV